MRASRLRHRMVLQEKGTVTQSASGQEEFTWVDVAILPSEARPTSGREVLRNGVSLALATTIVSTRYRAGVKPQMRLLWGDRTLGIEQAIDVDGRGRELELLCTEVVR